MPVTFVEVTQTKPRIINYTDSVTGRPAQRCSQEALLWRSGQQYPARFELSINTADGQVPYTPGRYHIDGSSVLPQGPGKNVSTYQVGKPSIGRDINLIPLTAYATELAAVLGSEAHADSDVARPRFGT